MQRQLECRDMLGVEPVISPPADPPIVRVCLQVFKQGRAAAAQDPAGGLEGEGGVRRHGRQTIIASVPGPVSAGSL